MASVKKTMKSSEAKQAKQPGSRSPKAKASQQSADPKAKKIAAARALAAKQLAAKQLAAKQLAAKKSEQKAKTKAKTTTKTKKEAAASSRGHSPATATLAVKNNKNKKATPAATRASASGKVMARAAKKAAAAARREKPATARAIAAKRPSATKRAGAARQAVSSKPARSKLAASPRKTPAIKASRRDAAEQPAATLKAAESLARQKPATGKDAAAALLAFKRNVAHFGEARKRATAAPPAVNSSDLSLESNERITVSKETKKKISTETSSVLTDAIASRPTAKGAAAKDSARVAAKSADMPAAAKSGTKAPVSKAPMPVENPPVAASDTPPKAAEAKPVERPAAPPQKPAKTGSPQRQLFKPGEFVVYPAHGVGQILVIEEQEVAGFKLELYVISFIKDKMILKVPTPKVASVGMRKLSDASAVKAALDTLAGRARVKRTMWSRRAQEYEAKINSGDLNAIAEVVRDLYRSDTQPEQSYSERQLYEAALDRMTREIVVVQKLTETESLKVIEAQLQKGPRRGGKAEEIDSEDAEIEEAA